VDIAGTNILSFAVEDLILILCVLGAIAEWRELRLIADVAHAIRQRGHLDFELLLERARKQGCGRFVLTALELARRQFNMEVPDLASSDNRTVDRLSGLLIGTLFDADTRKSDIFRITRTQLRLRERARDRLRYLARTALTPRIEHLKIIDLPAKLSWGYSVIKLCYDYVASPLGYPKRLIDNPGSGLPPAELAHAKANAKAQWQARSGAWERWAPSLISRSDLNDALIAAAHPATGYRMLDLACGVGDTSLALSPIVGPQGLVASTDLVVDMVEGARRRARGADLANMIFCVADMEALPYQDGSFDGVVCRLGIMYCPRVQLAFSEGRRVLKPGAHAAYLVCGLMENNPILAVTHNVIHELFALEADEDTPAPFRFGAKGSLAPLMIEAGFTEVEERELSFKRVAPKGTGFWRGGAERGLGIALESLPPDTYAELVRRMETAFAPYLKDDAYYFEHHSRVGIGRCPMPRRQG